MSERTFITALLKGETKVEEIGRWVAEWSRGPKDGPVWADLGFTEEQYKRCLEDEYNLSEVLQKACNEINPTESLFTSYPYASDIPLLRELKLKPFFVHVRHDREPRALGEVQHGDAKIAVSVKCTPAQFWEFNITRGGESQKIETGSGTLTEYWPHILKLAEGQALDRDMKRKLSM